MGTKAPKVEKKSDPNPPPVPQCNSCTDCDPWAEWGAWTAETSCPATINFGDALLKKGKENRSRTRICHNLCADAGCFTSNTEIRTTPCSCPEGKVLAADGTCVCDSSAPNRYYKDGNECKQCPSDYNFKQVNGAWVCAKPPTPTCDDCCDAWVETSVSKQAGDVCKDSEFTPTYTYARTCPNCSAGMACKLTKPKKLGVKTKGTKEPDCNVNCSWNDWTVWFTTQTCPSNASFDKSSIEQSRTRARTCNNDCSRSNCDMSDGKETQTTACVYCQGTGQKKLAEGKCECDETKRYYRTGNTCTQCPADKKLENGQCSDIPDIPPDIPEVAETKVAVPIKHETCEAGCDKSWNMTDWTWKLTTDECSANTAFAKPTLATETAIRTRTRACKDLKTGLECFTSNTETRTTTCEWCQGTGQEKLADGTCHCQHSSGYYEKDDACVECPQEKQLANHNGTWACVEQSCDGVCGEWQAAGDWTPIASNVCNGASFTPTRPIERTCPADRSACSKADTEQGAAAVGTKTIVCDQVCTWGEYGAWVDKSSCPVTTSLGSIPTKTQEATRARTCPAELCGQTCETSETKTRTSACSCTGAGQKKLTDGTCGCDTGYEPYMGGCKKEVVTVEEVEDEPPPPACQTTCEGCNDWELKDWTWSAIAECPSSSSFTAPPADTLKSRQRSRSCDNLCDNVACFTNNTESQTCEWCKGTGQKLDDMGVCVCNANQNYYKARMESGYESCVSCYKKIVNASGTGCVCAASSCTENNKKEWNSTNCTCGECQQEHVNECNGTLNANCDCIVAVVPDPTPQATRQLVSIYSNCFFMTNSALYLPVNPDLLGTKLKWRYKQCFDANETEYQKAVTALHSPSERPSGDLQTIIQKLYDCANVYDNNDKNSVQTNKQDFIDALLLNINHKRNCQHDSPNINVDITTDPNEFYP